MTLRDRLQAVVDEPVTPFEPVAGSWVWDINDHWFTFHYLPRPDTDGGFMMTVRTGYSPEAAASVLDAIQSHQSALARASPLHIIRGVSIPSVPFDAIAAVSPDVAERFEDEDDALNASTFDCFPCYSCEFPDELSAVGVQQLMSRTVKVAEWDRQPVPFVRARFAGITGYHTTGDTRKYVSADIVAAQLTALDGADAGFVEVENFEGAVRTLTWEDGIVLSDGADRIDLATDDARRWLDTFMTRGLAPATDDLDD